MRVSTRFGVHPTCRAQTRAAPTASTAQQPQPSLPSLPDLSAIASSRSSVLRHVPPQAKGAWCQVLTRALAAAVHFNSIAAWTELLMLPQAVLAAPPRTGRKHRKATAAFTLDRLRRWQEGERSTLWDTRTRLSRPPRGALTEEARAGLGKALIARLVLLSLPWVCVLKRLRLLTSCVPCTPVLLPLRHCLTSCRLGRSQLTLSPTVSKPFLRTLLRGPLACESNTCLTPASQGRLPACLSN